MGKSSSVCDAAKARMGLISKVRLQAVKEKVETEKTRQKTNYWKNHLHIMIPLTCRVDVV